MTRRYVLLAAASIALLAACSGSDGQARVSGPDPITAITSAPDTIQPEPAAAPAPAPATTEAVATPSTAPAPTTTTEPAPTTTLDPIAEIEAAVSRDFAAGEQALLEALKTAYTQSGSRRLAAQVGVVFDRVLNALYSEASDQG